MYLFLLLLTFPETHDHFTMYSYIIVQPGEEAFVRHRCNARSTPGHNGTATVKHVAQNVREDHWFCYFLYSAQFPPNLYV